jgi:hypothetical protein
MMPNGIVSRLQAWLAQAVSATSVRLNPKHLAARLRQGKLAMWLTLWSLRFRAYRLQVWVGDEADSITIGLTGEIATGQTGNIGNQVTVALVGESATGDVGSVGVTHSAEANGEEAQGQTGSVVIPPAPPILIDTHDGGDKKRKKKWQEEEEQRRRRKRELIEAYEALYEAKPQTAEQLAGPFITAPKSKRAEPTINWEGLIDDIARVEAIYREYREMDDEEVLLLL